MGRAAIGVAIKGLILSAIAVAAIVGLLWLFSLPVAELTASELALVLGLAGAGPVAYTISSMLGVLAARDLARLLDGLGLSVVVGQAEGSLGGVSVRAQFGSFERPDGKTPPVWFVLRLPEGEYDALVMRRADPMPDYGAALDEAANARGLPEGLSLRLTRGARAPAWLDEPALKAVLASPDFVQLRAGPNALRILLAFPLAEPLTLRRALVAMRATGSSSAADVEPAAPPPGAVERSKKSALPFVAASVVFGVSMIVLLYLIPDNEPYDDYILERVHACPLVAEALGTPVERQHLGGETSSASNKDVTTEIALEGPLGKGLVVVEGYKRSRGSRKVPIDAELRVGGERIAVFACARSWRPGVKGPIQLDGKVVASQGGSAVGSACQVDVTPVEGRVKCRATVACDGKALFGASGELGYTQCWMAEEGSISYLVARDLDPVDRTEPWLDLDLRTGHAKLGNPLWTIDIALEPRR
jgi:hypothetical protein